MYNTFKNWLLYTSIPLLIVGVFTVSSCERTKTAPEPPISNYNLEERVTSEFEDFKFDVEVQRCEYFYGAKVRPGTYFGLYASIKNTGRETDPNALIYLVYDGNIINIDNPKELEKSYEREDIIFRDEYFGGPATLPPVPNDAKKQNKKIMIIYALPYQDPLKDGKIIFQGWTQNFKCNVLVE